MNGTYTGKGISVAVLDTGDGGGLMHENEGPADRSKRDVKI